MVTEQQFAALAAACDRLLRASDTSLGRLAIPLLHVVSGHPTSVAQYQTLLRPGAATEGRSHAALLGAARDGLRVVRGLARAAWRSALVGELGPARAIGSVDALLVSHLGNADLLDPEDDFYFGALQRMLLERGRTSLLVLVNHTLGDESALHARATRPPPCARLLLRRAVRLPDEARLWVLCRRARRRLRQAAMVATSPLERAVAGLASRRALSAHTAANLRLHASIAWLSRLLRPKVVITTHEGDASERMVWHAARAAVPETVCVGYQHTRLFAHSHAIRRSIGTPGCNGDPDVILTLGDVTHSMLAASPGLGPVRLISYGSHRRGAPTTPLERSARPRQCVVLPDADDGECSTLFGFALECARRMPTMIFSLRPHPIVGFDVMRARHPWLRRLPDNVEASERVSLDQELARARYALHRGSSAAIYAVLAGLKPFYLARPAEMTCDSLFALAEWRETVSSPEDFIARVEADEAQPQLLAAARAWRFCDRYIARLRPEALDELLAMTR